MLTEDAAVAGPFSFREMPPLPEAYQQLPLQPDLFICDGQGWHTITGA
ncbi:endonuclease V [Chitinophaga sp. 212800010-3]|nr:hypothetical protein [Chitinophaga sp. 212800010-3]